MYFFPCVCIQCQRCGEAAPQSVPSAAGAGQAVPLSHGRLLLPHGPGPLHALHYQVAALHPQAFIYLYSHMLSVTWIGHGVLVLEVWIFSHGLCTFDLILHVSPSEYRFKVTCYRHVRNMNIRLNAVHSKIYNAMSIHVSKSTFSGLSEGPICICICCTVYPHI